MDYARIVVPLDGTPVAERALPHALSLARRYGAALTLVRTYSLPGDVAAATVASGLPGTGPVVDPAPFVEVERTAAEGYLEATANELRGQGLTVDYDEEDARAADGIVELAARAGADLIVMATHARSGLSRLLAGSVAEHVVQHAPCPVLLVPVHEEA